MTLKAVFFDFNGIVIDDEHVHCELFQKVLKEEGIDFTEKHYWDDLLAMDDRGVFTHVFNENGKGLDGSGLQKLIDRKAGYYMECITDRMTIFPGITELINSCAKHIPVIVVSGALRAEIDLVLAHLDIKQAFADIIAAEDVKVSKPDPECYNLALNNLNNNQSSTITAADVWVIEDSIAGIESAKSANMSVIAVTNTYKAEKLGRANKIIETCTGIDFNQLNSWHSEFSQG